MKLTFALMTSLLLTIASSMHGSEGPTVFSEFEHTFPKDENFFPIGVWTQSPANAAKYKAMGVNFYYGLWAGPTAEQIAGLKKHDMYVICQLNEYAQKSLLDEKIVVGWMHRDEPDLAHVYPRKLLKGPKGKQIIKEKWPEIYKELDLDNNEYNGWGMGAHPINDIQADYKRYKKIDTKRPVYLQLSKGVALNGKLAGRGDRSGKTWEYPEYIKGSDCVTYDIYPVAYGYHDKLYLTGDGVSALKKWGSDKRPLMVAIEAGFGEDRLANQAEQRAQIWMSINHGAKGIFWFVHRWKNKKLLSEKMPLDDPQIGKQVKAINEELHSLAAVINSKERNDLVSAAGANLDLGARKHGGATYVFAVERAGKAGSATISIKGLTSGTAEVINESRTVPVKDGKIVDDFAAWGTHLYKIK